MISYKDFNGDEVKIGDIVIATRVKYRNLLECEVILITPKMVNLKTIKDMTGYGRSEFKQFHQQTILKRK